MLCKNWKVEQHKNILVLFNLGIRRKIERVISCWNVLVITCIGTRLGKSSTTGFYVSAVSIGLFVGESKIFFSLIIVCPCISYLTPTTAINTVIHIVTLLKITNSFDIISKRYQSRFLFWSRGFLIFKFILLLHNLFCGFYDIKLIMIQ